MKKILIDGHNLIPKVGGISLSDPEDEAKLTARVSEYCRLAKVKAELFFDGAPPGKNATSRLGLINVHHVRQGTTADAAIIQYLHREGYNARNLLVVSSDHEVQNKARMLHADRLRLRLHLRLHGSQHPVQGGGMHRHGTQQLPHRRQAGRRVG